tara:strand:- start:227 stop:496 length:270 start_codon:yes stop_codon:yes gene_type:complete
MKNFRVQIRAYGKYADFEISAEDGPISIENAIVDKLGKGDIKWEDEGFYNPSRKFITYEEVIDGENDATSTRPLPQEEGSGSRMGAGAS